MSDRDLEASSSSLGSSIIERARGGDEAALAVIDILYRGLVSAWCRQLGVLPADVEDVVQDVFSNVWRGLRQFRRDDPSHSFRGWLRTIVGNRIIDLRRASQRQVVTVPLFGDISLDNLSAESTTAETKLLYARAIQLIKGEFSKRDVDIFLLLIVEGASPRDVAEKFQIKISRVFVIKSLMLKRLRDYFGELLEGDV